MLDILVFTYCYATCPSVPQSVYDDAAAFWNKNGQQVQFTHYEEKIDRSPELVFDPSSVGYDARLLRQALSLPSDRPIMFLVDHAARYKGWANRINKAFFVKKKDNDTTAKTIAHEIGHLLNLDHVEDENNLMHPYACPGAVLKKCKINP